MPGVYIYVHVSLSGLRLLHCAEGTNDHAPVSALVTAAQQT